MTMPRIWHADVDRAALLEAWRHERFEVVGTQYVRHDELPEIDVREALVAEGLYFSGGRFIDGFCPAVPVLDWMCHYSQLECKETPPAGPRATKGDVLGKVLQFPWVKEHMRVTQERRIVEHDSAPADEPDDVVAAAWFALEAHHAVGRDHLIEGDDFFVRFRMTPGSVEVFGAEAKRGMPRTWCALYSLGNSTSFSVTTMGSSEAAVQCATRWRDTMQHFYNIWRSQGDMHYRFAEDELREVPEDTEWSAFKASLHVGSHAAERAIVIDHVRPRNC
jgi:hypothetical protein